MTMYLFRLPVLGKGRSMSMATKSGGPAGKNSLSFLFSLLIRQFLVRDMQFAAVFQTLSAMWGQ